MCGRLRVCIGSFPRGNRERVTLGHSSQTALSADLSLALLSSGSAVLGGRLGSWSTGRTAHRSDMGFVDFVREGKRGNRNVNNGQWATLNGNYQWWCCSDT